MRLCVVFVLPFLWQVGAIERTLRFVFDSNKCLDGYSRISGKVGVCIGQNGPGVTNFVTAIAAAYWAHSPVVLITPETGTATMGLGGFQETEQLPLFSKITKFQAHVANRARIAELTSRCFDRALLEMGPTQINIPRDLFYGDIECEIPKPIRVSRGSGDEAALDSVRCTISNIHLFIFCLGRTGGGVVGQCELSGDSRWRRRRVQRRRAAVHRARRAAAGAGRQLVPAQRLVSGVAFARRRPARLSSFVIECAHTTTTISKPILVYRHTS